MLLGAIADDYTGATDLANTLVQAGMKVVQVLGVPGPDTPIGDAQAVVVALKSRTAPVAQAVAHAVQAHDWLRERGARQVLFKYCSTFDSSAAGNIGPVADALLVATDEDFALICPAFPANGRTVFKGHLFVGDDPLDESPMKDHPLTPMRDSSLLRLMGAQTNHRVGLIGLEHVSRGPDAITRRIAALKAKGVTYGVVDAVSDRDLISIGQAAHGMRLVTGGSAVAMALPANLRATHGLAAASAPPLPDCQGRRLVISGSCSAATRGQIEQVRGHWPTHKIDTARLQDSAALIDDATTWARAQPTDTPLVIYSSANADEVQSVQATFGVTGAGGQIEDILSTIAKTLVADGFDQLVVAGGETSGAVVSALGLNALQIGPEIAPGVPWTQSVGGDRVALALKSGNFGAPTFFEDAFAMLP